MTTTTAYPIEKLSEPQPSDPIHDYVELVISGNGTSLTYHLNNLITMATSLFVDGGFNCIGTITNNLTGDWVALQKSSDAIRKLSEYNSAYRDAIDAAMGNVETSWQGNAAQSARTYFSSLTTALDGQTDAMSKIAEEIDAYALASYGMANGIADLVQTLGDMAIQWAATEIAATTKVVKIIGDLGHMVNASEALVGLIVGGLSAAVEASQIPALPSASYDHPGVQ
ncbi:hypothetical protein [Nocardia salmonicida]|uniref:hypothetical protein n=1 Tax=Nocardia salmonicida TaxID=53431 RepID=UPI0033D6BE17